MRYPILTENDVSNFIQIVLANPADFNSSFATAFATEHARFATTPGDLDARQIDLTKIQLVSDEINLYLARPASGKAGDPAREKYEGDISSKVHQALVEVPYEVLDDQRFWQYLAIRYFSQFIIWRQDTAISKGTIGNYLFASRQDSMPLRMYLRARMIVESTNSYELASAIPEGADFWKSHILRVRTGRAKGVIAAFATMQRDERLATAPLRQLAKLINRMWSNVVLFEYEHQDATTLVDELRTRALKPKE
jgi:hypothetical protein